MVDCCHEDAPGSTGGGLDDATPVRTVAALYVDPRGPYPGMPGVECWDEARDARLYPGPWPVVAHPPCGPWSRLKHFSRHQPKDCAPIAVEQVRRWGGVLEHPKASSLWRHCDLPLPGGLPGPLGDWSVELNQVSWGHPAEKATWLYVVGAGPSSVRLLRGGVATHCVSWGGKHKHRRTLPKLGGIATHLTPPAFAEFLVELARQVRHP